MKKNKKKVVLKCILWVCQTLVLFASVSFLWHGHATLELVANQKQSLVDNPHSASASSPIVNDTRRILLVHVGKTGGETLKRVLRIGCAVRKNPVQQALCWHDFAQLYDEQEPLLSRLVQGHMHYRRTTPPTALAEATHLLFTIRHPLSRIQSWYRYISPRNCVVAQNVTVNAETQQRRKEARRRQHEADGVPLTCRVQDTITHNPTSLEARFFECFATLEQLAQTIPHLSPRTNNRGRAPSEECVTLLKDLWQSDPRRLPSETLLGHWVFNYQYYVQHTAAVRSELPLLAVRTESLWHDVQGLEDYLTNDTTQSANNAFNTVQGLQVAHYEHNARVATVDRADLSPEATRHLCCLLQPELEVYRTLVERAHNLALAEKERTLAQSTELCHWGSSWNAVSKGCRAYHRRSPNGL